MTDPDSFLLRWARRKRDSVGDAAQEPGLSGSASPPAEADGAHPPVTPENKNVPEAPFDPASLPSLDSIRAQTDIRAFLQAGVPPDLARAALRRAWTADPAIRNFKGLQENDWDFNDPNGMFGFGELDPGFDVKRMLASVFGETPMEAASPPAGDDLNRESAKPVNEEMANENHLKAECAQTLPAVNDGTANGLNSTDAMSSPADVSMPERTTDAATHQGGGGSTTTASARAHRHGGALPR
jgi:hypothetical protein